MVHVSLFPTLNVLHFHVNTFRSNCAVSNMAVVCSLYVVLSRYAAQVLTERFRDGSSYDYYNCHYRCLLIQLLYCLINDLSTLLFVFFAAYVSYLLSFVICVSVLCCFCNWPSGCWIGTLTKINCSWLQTFAVSWMLHAFFWVIPRRLNFMWFYTHLPAYEDGIDSVFQNVGI